MGRDDQAAREGGLAALSHAEHILRASGSGYAADQVAAIAEEVRGDVEYRIETRGGIAYTRTASRAARATFEGRRVWKRTPARPASAWELIPVILG